KEVMGGEADDLRVPVLEGDNGQGKHACVLSGAFHDADPDPLDPLLFRHRPHQLAGLAGEVGEGSPGILRSVLFGSPANGWWTKLSLAAEVCGHDLPRHRFTLHLPSCVLWCCLESRTPRLLVL